MRESALLIQCLVWSNVAVLVTGQIDQSACKQNSPGSPIQFPTTFQLDMCLTTHLGDLLAGSSKSSKCNLIELMGLVKSPLWSTFAKNLGGVLSSNASAESVRAFYQTLPVPALCSDWNQKVTPCLSVLVQLLVQIIEDDAVCCYGLHNVFETFKSIVPPGSTLTSMIPDLLNGFNQMWCTTVNGGSFKPATTCGDLFVPYLTSLPSPNFLLLDIILPFYTMSKDSVCSAVESTSYVSGVNNRLMPFFKTSCCACGLAAMLNTVEGIYAQLFGDSMAQTLDVIASSPVGTFQSTFQSIPKCSFQSTCTLPSGLIPSSNNSSQPVVPGSKNNGKVAANVQCGSTTSVCDQSGKVCSTVCAAGTASVSPWLKFATKYQTTLSYTKPLCSTQLITTHNSAITLARGFGNRDQALNANLDPKNAQSFVQTNNQILSITDQLNLGVRMVEIDFHTIANKIRVAHCNANINNGLVTDSISTIRRHLGAQVSSDIEWDASLIGCVPSLSGIQSLDQLTLLDQLNEISQWLNQPAHANDIVFIYSDIGSDIYKFSKLNIALDIFRSVFKDSIVLPQELSTTIGNGTSWEEIPLQQFRLKNKRVILLASKGNDLMFDKYSMCGGWLEGPPQKTVDQDPAAMIDVDNNKYWGIQVPKGSIVRAYADNLRYGMMDKTGTITNINSVPLFTITAKNISPFIRAGIVLPSLDSIDGAIINGMIWSWAPQEPQNGTVAVVMKENGSWYGSNVAVDKYACFNASLKKWFIAASPKACGDGFTFSAPTSPVENLALQRAMQSLNVRAVALSIDLTNVPKFDDPGLC